MAKSKRVGEGVLVLAPTTVRYHPTGFHCSSECMWIDSLTCDCRLFVNRHYDYVRLARDPVNNLWKRCQQCIDGEALYRLVKKR